jgi:hypothetical protein
MVYAFSVHWLIAPVYFLTVPLLGWLSSTLSRRIKTVQKVIVAETTALAGAIAMAAGDFNNDGNIDLVLGSNDLDSGGYVQALLGNGQGGFMAAPADWSPVSFSAPASLAVGDLNSDGRLDAVMVCGPGGSVGAAFLGNGDGRFPNGLYSPEFVTGPDPLAVAIGDFTGDGIPDVVTTSTSDPGTWYAQARVNVLPGRGDGALAEPPIGLRQRVPRGIGLRLRRANFVRSRRHLGRLDRGFQLLNVRLVVLEPGARIVQRGAADEAGFEQGLLTAQIRSRQFTRRHRLAQLLGDHLDLGRALACLQVGKPRIGCLQFLLGLATAGDFILALEREQRRARAHLATALHRKLLQRAGKRRGHAHVLALDVSLQRLLGTRTARGQQRQQRQQSRESPTLMA